MPATELSELFDKLKQLGFAAGVMQVSGQDDVWKAIRQFFRDQAQVAA